ncbi:Zinc finger protein [Zalerion maritima]|uniref:Zinc finger protein n=1 Tax=Zalerion maritima TaxID=339359 RepID=A0AAD5S0B8_9PEZI|nr:Zinc finger protein [Zalerion maritima]
MSHHRAYHRHAGKKWFDCASCHAESQQHELLKTTEMAFACKKCKKCFRKNADEFEEADEYCPHCDNHFVVEALEPKAALVAEGDDVRVDNRMLKGGDNRTKEGGEKMREQMAGGKEIWDLNDETDKRRNRRAKSFMEKSRGYIHDLELTHFIWSLPPVNFTYHQRTYLASHQKAQPASGGGMDVWMDGWMDLVVDEYRGKLANDAQNKYHFSSLKVHRKAQN